jgi:hypothetical protein
MTDTSEGPIVEPAPPRDRNDPDPWRLGSSPKDLIGAGVMLGLLLAISGALAALLTANQCGTNPPPIANAPVQTETQTAYCRLTHFPGLPDTVGSGLVLAGIFLLPVLVALGGALLAANRRSRTLYRLTSVLAVGLAIFAWVMVTQAGVVYPQPG